MRQMLQHFNTSCMKIFNYLWGANVVLMTQMTL